jgi:hypothetical protein
LRCPAAHFSVRPIAIHRAPRGNIGHAWCEAFANGRRTPWLCLERNRMIRWMSHLGWLGCFGLAWLGATGIAQAWDNPLVKVSQVRVNFHVELSTTPDPLRPTAPWYAYFPADPRLMPSPQLSPYPPWPTQFPPVGPPFDASKGAQPQSRNRTVTPGPMQTQWSNPIAYGGNLQPVGYVPNQVPSYWYQQR